MPADINALEKGDITTNYAGNLLCHYNGMSLFEDIPNYGWKMTTTNDAVNADNTGTATWWMHSRTYSSVGPYDYCVSDSVSLPGGGGILQLSSLAFTSGQPAPGMTDFRLGVE